MALERFFVALAGTMLLASANVSLADVFPNGPIKLVLPLAAGGATDNLARIVGTEVTAKLGQPLIIENRPGGSGSIASNAVAKANPDGLTLLLANFATHAVAPSIFASLPYDPIKDFAPVSLLASSPHVLLVNNDLKARTVMELIVLAQQTPGALNFASSGVGSPLHLAGEYFKMQAGIDIVHVPYRSSVPALVDLISGRVQMMFDNLSTGLPYVGSGKLRALAVTSPQRSALAPDLPTVNEAGLRGFDTYGWWGILAPAQTPPRVVETLSVAFMAAIRVKELVANLSEQGYDPIGAPPAAFAAHIEHEIAKWRPVIRATGLVAGN